MNRWILRCGWIAAGIVLGVSPLSEAQGEAGGPCRNALKNDVVCQAANECALELMKTGNLEAVIVMQNVETGGLVMFAASDPAKLDVTTAVLPLSSVKLLAAAAWLDHEAATRTSLPESDKLLDDSIVSGNDNAGRRIASTLREVVGAETVVKDLARYGFPGWPDKATNERNFWAGLAPRWRDRLVPAPPYHSLGADTPVKEWEDTLSLGEERFVVTALHLSRFLQAVGNGGTMLPAAARAEPGSTVPAGATRVMSETAALKLQAAMRQVVERGTAKSAAPILAGTGWAMGGKTGTGPEPGTNTAGPGSDGCFVGLIFDPEGKARFTVATFVKHGGLGGGNAARISAKLARFLSGANPID